MHSALAPPINSEPALLPMDIYLTNHANVRNTKFCAANGQVLYKSETEGFVLSPHKKTTIYKIIPNDAPEDMGTLPHFSRIRGVARKLTGHQQTDFQNWLLLSGAQSHLRD